MVVTNRARIDQHFRNDTMKPYRGRVVRLYPIDSRHKSIAQAMRVSITGLPFGPRRLGQQAKHYRY